MGFSVFSPRPNYISHISTCNLQPAFIKRGDRCSNPHTSYEASSYGRPLHNIRRSILFFKQILRFNKPLSDTKQPWNCYSPKKILNPKSNFSKSLPFSQTKIAYDIRWTVPYIKIIRLSGRRIIEPFKSLKDYICKIRSSMKQGNAWSFEM